ncbi:MAG: SMC-Scp complex subunit ScpB [Proteobacteria bacterium]|jgi:segregation and condensation protein B|nr:SMC-Scp complex subunit ScpB [Pseudomonadota bacterium]
MEQQSKKLKDIIEVALLTAGKPLSIEDLQKLFMEKIERSTIRMLLDEIKIDWQEKSMDLVQVATGYRFEAKVKFSENLTRLNPDRLVKYSRVVMEVLAIIAYRQPVTRGDIEKIRGVSLNPNAIRQLVEREWIEIIGYKEVPGRPALYGTTKFFLDDFSLTSLSQLPDINTIGLESELISANQEKDPSTINDLNE